MTTEEVMNLTIYEKMALAIEGIREKKIVKNGTNTYSKYDYFTPEIIDDLVHKASIKYRIFTEFSLVRNDLGLEGVLTITNIDNPDDMLVYKLATDVPQITATNITQQYGGAQTYTKRYILMNAFNISDNSADFDTTENTVKKDVDNRTWINANSKEFEQAEMYLQQGGTIDEILKKYRISKKVQELLTNK